jgi:uncharacterized protein YcsI (UPF0317 family)
MRWRVRSAADLRNAVPRYRVWRDGVMDQECASVEDVWAETGDMVCFLLGMSTPSVRTHSTPLDVQTERSFPNCSYVHAGCSFSWEDKLAQAGLVPRHAEIGCNVPMYRYVFFVSNVVQEGVSRGQGIGRIILAMASIA